MDELGLDDLRILAQFAQDCADDLDEDALTADEWRACKGAMRALDEIATQWLYEIDRLEHEDDMGGIR